MQTETDNHQAGTRLCNRCHVDRLLVDFYKGEKLLKRCVGCREKAMLEKRAGREKRRRPVKANLAPIPLEECFGNPLYLCVPLRKISEIHARRAVG